MISTVNLIWICPVCLYLGMLTAALFTANGR